MNFVLWNPRMDLYESAYRIFEPVEGIPVDPSLSIQVAFVLLLAFDARGYRLGYGKGFYDRFSPPAPRIFIK
ncbi:5-formyltetrahydrofolate cyclo-ligase [Bacteroidetes bacterium endosymbiont of Geopemphigus sp.]|uniref:5-formyltetrahydrofolate cyclo-ligase n=1 Tax=Bacteroidetes bacterium endosymbiont of Geopemphigus sp. TaxID=2047937 RepID=UPI000CD19157|nr:5-formyltetrahydrofolate cyclo-ligase [Bacteroidetes bacterium endosymbiont of Geopemphigus sp.]